MSLTLPVSKNRPACGQCSEWLREYEATPDGDGLKTSHAGVWGWCQSKAVKANTAVINGRKTTGPTGIQTTEVSSCRHFEK